MVSSLSGLYQIVMDGMAKSLRAMEMLRWVGLRMLMLILMFMLERRGRRQEEDGWVQSPGVCFMTLI